MTKTDPFELFKALSPYLDEPGRDSPDEGLLARIKTEPRDVAPLHHSKRRVWAVGGALAVTVLATAAFAVLRSSPASEPTTIVCAATEDPQGDVVGVAGASDPVAACSVLWSDGTLGTGPVPPLAGCVNANGTVVVLPGGATSVCSKAGLDLLDLDADNSENLDVLAVEEHLIDTFLNDCYDQDDALAEVRRILDDAGLVEWTVTLAGDFPDGLNCAGINVDASEQQVTVAGARPS